MLQSLRQHQIPPLPGTVPTAAAPFAAPALPPAPVAPPAQPDALSMLRMILSNPQFQHALHWSAVMGPAGPRSVHLPMPAPGPAPQVQTTPIPLGAVMNAISMLAGRSMTDLNAGTREDDPEVPAYLVDAEGEFIVDPADSERRADLVGYMFAVSEEARRAGLLERHDPPLPGGGFEQDGDAELDESELWAREAGFW